MSVGQLINNRLDHVYALVCENNIVWANRINYSMRAESTDETPHDFANFPGVRNWESVYVLGNERNADLICELSKARINNPECRTDIYIGSPGKEFRADADYDMSYALSYMARLHSRTGSTGGWHLLEPSDVSQYSLMRALSESSGQLTPEVSRILRGHPAWPALSFIPTVNEESAAQLLQEIIDPRWYTSISHPDRLSRLKGFVGLTDGNIQAILAGKTKPGKRYRLARTLYRAWAAGTDGYSEDIEHPGNFLLRKLRDYNSDLRGTREQKKAATARAVLRTCNHFLAFLRNVWLHQLTQDSFNNIAVDLFIPEYFFESESDAKAYHSHVSTLIN